MSVDPVTGEGRIAIVGAGWAGLACARQLVNAGIRPVIFESASEAGGRARRARIHGDWRDNGQHLMLAGCKALARLLAEEGVQLPRTAFEFTAPGTGSSNMQTLSLPATGGKFALIVALCRARGFPIGERLALILALSRLQFQRWQVPDTLTVSGWLQKNRQPASLIRTFWEPMALAILNTPLHSAAMSKLAHVLRDTLGRDCKALRLIRPTANLTDSVVNQLVENIRKQGGILHLGHRVRAIQRAQEGGLAVTVGDRSGNITQSSFDRVVLAVPPWTLSKIHLPAEVPVEHIAATQGSQPIATVYLGFSPSFSLPVPLLQIPGPTGSDARIWAMDRAHCNEPGVIAVSVSASGPWTQLSGEDLATACLASLQEAWPATPDCLWNKSVIVKQATPSASACTGQDNPVEAFVLGRTLVHCQTIGLHITGDWTDGIYPATLEAAVRSGLAAADSLLNNAGIH